MNNFDLCELLRDELIRCGIKCDHIRKDEECKYFYIIRKDIMIKGSVVVYNDVVIVNRHNVNRYNITRYSVVKQAEFNINDPDLICNIVKIFNLPWKNVLLNKVYWYD